MCKKNLYLTGGTHQIYSCNEHTWALFYKILVFPQCLFTRENKKSTVSQMAVRFSAPKGFISYINQLNLLNHIESLKFIFYKFIKASETNLAYKCRASVLILSHLQPQESLSLAFNNWDSCKDLFTGFCRVWTFYQSPCCLHMFFLVFSFRGVRFCLGNICERFARRDLC